MKSIASLIIVADAAAVIYIEKILMVPWVTGGHVVHATARERVIVGLIVALPTLLVLLVAWWRARGPAKPAPSAQRTGYTFGSRL